MFKLLGTHHYNTLPVCLLFSRKEILGVLLSHSTRNNQALEATGVAPVPRYPSAFPVLCCVEPTSGCTPSHVALCRVQVASKTFLSSDTGGVGLSGVVEYGVGRDTTVGRALQGGHVEKNPSTFLARDRGRS